MLRNLNDPHTILQLSLVDILMCMSASITKHPPVPSPQLDLSDRFRTRITPVHCNTQAVASSAGTLPLICVMHAIMQRKKQLDRSRASEARFVEGCGLRQWLNLDVYRHQPALALYKTGEVW
jgi:hypothetical protein